MHLDRRTLAWVLAGTLLGVARTTAAPLGDAATSSEPVERVPATARNAVPAGDALDLSLGPTLELAELVAAVLERNASLAASEAAVRAMRATAEQATKLEDPTARAMLAPLSFGGGAPLGYEFQASQMIPYPGKRHLRGETARNEATAAVEDLQAARLDLAAEAASLYADYYLNSREVEINAEHLALLRVFQQVATARYAAGLVPQQAPLQAEVEAARMLHHEVELRATQQRLVARMNALLHRPASSPLPPPAKLEPRVEAAMDHGAPQAAAGAGRPELRALRARVAARQADLELARRGRYPDFEVMAGYSSLWDVKEHRWSVGLGINLPIRRERIRAEVAVAQARLDQAAGELEQRSDELDAEAVIAAADRQEMAHLVELYRDRVVPAARDQVAAARASFESGEGSMLDLIQAERSLRDAQQQYHEAVAGYVRAGAAVARSLGELAGGQQIPAAPTPPGER